eukprot:jgi/Picsp_1/816/NSC_04305-R1_d-aspartate oxidase
MGSAIQEPKTLLLEREYRMIGSQNINNKTQMHKSVSRLIGSRQAMANKRRSVSRVRSVSMAGKNLPLVQVIGGGVIGLASALRISNEMDVRVEIVAEKIAKETTSEGAGGLWKPFALTGTRADLTNRWGKETLDHYMSLFLSPDAEKAGIILTSAYELYEKKEEEPEWAHIVPGFRHLTPEEIHFYDPSGRHVHGIAYDTIIAEGRLYMQYLLEKLCSQNEKVTITKKRLDSIDDVMGSEEASVVVNCTGLGARELFKDESMFAIRGHVLRVKAPWVRHHVESHSLDETRPAYIIPNTDTVVLGGTKDVGNEDTESREEERREIFDQCKAIVPSLEGAEVVSSWVGLRPGRIGIRLEKEDIILNGHTLPCIHNYGHGGSGLTLAWGCAGDVVELVKESVCSKQHDA